MEEERDEVLEPMSPSAQFLKSSALSLTILGVLELENPLDDSMAITLLKDLFLPINPRFSSIMVEKKGIRKWKRVEVNLKEHLYHPIFPSEMTLEYYDQCFNEYISKIAMEQLPKNRPLWEIHILKYPTKNAAGNLIFKLHHSLGDGYSLMGALLSCLQRADNPLLPLTFPSRHSNTRPSPKSNTVFRRVPRLLTGLVHTVYDFAWGMMKSSLVQDDISPIRSGEDGLEFKPIIANTTEFSIDQLKEIKNKLDVTINDVITGIVTLGIRLYMQKKSPKSGLSQSTALVVLNTRSIGGNYKSVDEMVKPNSRMPWGNRFAFLHVPIPKLIESDDDQLQNPLIFINKANRMIKRQKNTATIFLTGQLLDFIRKIRGHEAGGGYIHATLKNTSMTFSNLIGPVEKMALANQPIKGLYYVVAGNPQSLTVTMISYVGKLRIAMTMEKDFMDPNKLKSCIEYAFEVIYKAALDVESPPTTIKKFN